MTKKTDNEEQYEYVRFLGLSRNPFPVAPDDANFYLSETIEEIVAEIVHGVCTRKGFIILTGDVGLGKTTISRRVIGILESRKVITSLVLHTSLQEVELLRAINNDFGIQGGFAQEGLGAQMKRLNDFLLSQYAQGRNCAIFIDDAQNLNRASLELVRMISNLEVNQEKLVQIILVGQTEMVTCLNAPALRQLRSRIVIRKVVRSLSRQELQHYILFKLSSSGDKGGIHLTPSAFRRLYRITRGNFRKVNLLMDRCLYAICTHGGSHGVTRKIVDMAASDLNPEEQKHQTRLTALAVSLIVPLMIVSGSWFAHFYTSRGSLADMPALIRNFKVPAHYAVGSTRDGKKRAAGQHALPTAAARAQNLDPAVVAFLGIYQLDRYASEFRKAIQEGTLTGLSQRIYAQTGFQLIQLPTMADDIRRRYGALAFNLTPGQPPTWLLFWRPQLKLKHFYYNYQGEEILELQKLFCDLQFYRYNLDGIVGTRLMNSVIAFQKHAGLPVTGFPDAATVFKLYHEKEINADA